MKLLLITAFTLITCINHLSAQSFSIKGEVIDKKDNTAVGYASIKLYSNDSVLINGTTTNEKGKFILTDIKLGNYKIITSFIGYQDNISLLNNINQNIDLGTIYLEEALVSLKDITVSASNIVTKVDRQIVLPTDKQLKTSSSGVDLLNNMMLPGLKVDILQNSISTIGGDNVQLRINDIKVNTQQVLALQPGDVIRVEYIDNPGIRYADENVSAVINFIVKRYNSGVNAGVNLTNAVNKGFGDDNVYIKANHKNSEFGLNYFLSYRDYKDRFVNTNQFFLLPDSSIRNRDSRGISVPFNYTLHYIETSYNLTKLDTYIFNAVFKSEIFNAPKRDVANTLYENGVLAGSSYSKMTDKNTTPSLDLYYMKYLPNKQSLTLNVVGTHIGSDFSRNFKEYNKDNELYSDYGYSTDGSKYSLISEGIYEKEFKPFKFSSGFQHTQSHTENTYKGTTEAITLMNSNNSYLYSQIQGKLKKLNYMLGIGVSRQSFSEENESFNFVTIRPSLMLSYPIFKDATIRYNFNITPTLPSLSNLSDVRQQQNDFEVNVGNPRLKPYRNYNNQLQIRYQYKRINTQLNANYSYSKNPIMAETNRIDSPTGYIFEYGFDNQISFKHMSLGGNTQINIIENIVSLNTYYGFNSYISNGHQYKHNYTAWYGGGQVSASYKNYSLGAWLSSRYNTFYGERIRFGENNCGINFGYKIKNVRLGAGVWYPFVSKGWSAGSKNLSKIASLESWTYIKDNSNMFSLSFSWNVNYGRKHQSGKKTLSNSDNDSGIVK